jgi:hypothetical protein
MIEKIADVCICVANQILEQLDADGAAQERFVAVADARPVIAEADARLGDVSLHDIAVQRHAEHPLLDESHAENQVRLIQFGRAVEQRPQVVRMAEGQRNIRRSDEKRTQRRVGRPCRLRQHSYRGQRRDLGAQEGDHRLDRRRQAFVVIGQQLQSRVGEFDRPCRQPSERSRRTPVRKARRP